MLLLTHGSWAAIELPAADQWYFGLGLGQSRFDPQLSDSYRLSDSGDVAGKLLVGAELTPRFSLEVGVNSLGTVGLSPSGKLSYDAYALEGVFYVINGPAYQSHDLGKDFSLYGRFGLNHLNASTLGPTVDDGFQMTFGIGVEQYLRHGYAVRGEWQQISDEVSLWAISLVRRFNHQRQAQENSRELPLPNTINSSPPTTYIEPDERPRPRPIPMPVSRPSARPLAEPTLSETRWPPPPQSTQSATGRPVPRAPSPTAQVTEPTELPAPQAPQAPPVANRGDNDRDGVINYRDVCDHTPPSLPASPATGCAFTRQQNPISFDPNSVTLTANATAWLDQVLSEIQANPQLEFEVHAYTDSRGDALTNLQLSGQRAAAVVRYLEEKGVNRSRMLPIGQGETRPIANNDTAEGRAINRRVQMVLLD